MIEEGRDDEDSDGQDATEGGGDGEDIVVEDCAPAWNSNLTLPLPLFFKIVPTSWLDPTEHLSWRNYSTNA